MRLPNDLATAIRETPVAEGGIAVFWLGQAFFVIKGADGTRIAVDPFFSEVVYDLVGWRRLFPPPFPASTLDVDVVVFTHDHVDHYDPQAVPEIAEAAPHTRFAGPGSCLEHARRDGIPDQRLHLLERGDSWQVGGAKLQAVFAEHLTVGDPAIDAIGIVIEMGGVKLYHTGDTVYNSQLQKSGRTLRDVDLLLVPINGNFAVMNSLDAALYTEDVEPTVVIPMHYGMFSENTADPYLFVRDLHDRKVAATPVIMAIGSMFLYPGS